ncbi:MAG: Metallophosphoesterase, calcineurin superfamily protein [Bacteriophage sp.]|nr:MAG: Metallophosphoesterase, calcineurin superfamily protein [Bacteriophage sp.]
MEFVYDPIKQYDYNEELRGRFNSFIVTEFDDSMTVEMQLRSIIKWVKQNINSISEMVGFINAFNEWLSSCKYEQHIIKLLNKWLDTGRLLETLKEDLNFEYTIDLMEKRIDELKDYFADADFYSKKELNQEFSTTEQMGSNIELRQLYDIEPIFENTHTSYQARIDNKLTPNTKIIHAMTDTHYLPDSSYFGGIMGGSIKALGHVNNMLMYSKNAIATLFLGDNVDSTDLQKMYHFSLNRGFVQNVLGKTQCPTFFFKGNHDDGSFGYYTNYRANNAHLFEGKTYQDVNVTNEDFSKLYRWSDRLYGEMRQNGSGYFYYDVDNIRIIGLDSYDNPENPTLTKESVNAYHSQYQIDQIKWLLENALQDVEDKHILFATHCPLAKTINDNPTTVVTNHDKVLEIIEKFTNGGTVDLNIGVGVCDLLSYTFEGHDNVIGFITGHLHYTKLVRKNNVNHLTLDTDLYASNPTDKGYWETENESNFHSLLIDTDTKTVNLVSFSRNKDLTYNYGKGEPYV